MQKPSFYAPSAPAVNAMDQAFSTREQETMQQVKRLRSRTPVKKTQ
jgi:hypothetical protein